MWVAIAFLVGVLLLCIEAFLPGGIIGIVGVIAIGISMVLGFVNYGAGTGLAIFMGELVATMGLVMTWLAVFPRTRIGKHMILQEDLSAEDGYTGQADNLEDFAGKTGSAETDLRPAGVVRIDGRRVDAVTEGVFLESGAEIAVVEVDGNRVVVREVNPAATVSDERQT